MTETYYTYTLTWSAKDNEYVGLCAAFPSVSWLAKTPEAALKGIRKIVATLIKDMEKSGEPIPHQNDAVAVLNEAIRQGKWTKSKKGLCLMLRGDLPNSTVITSKEARTALSKMVMELFDHWNIQVDARADLLGVSKSSIRRYQSGAALANKADIIARVSHLLAIHRALRVLYPKNREIIYKWAFYAER